MPCAPLRAQSAAVMTLPVQGGLPLSAAALGRKGAAARARAVRELMPSSLLRWLSGLVAACSTLGRDPYDKTSRRKVHVSPTPFTPRVHGPAETLCSCSATAAGAWPREWPQLRERERACGASAGDESRAVHAGGARAPEGALARRRHRRTGCCSRRRLTCVAPSTMRPRVQARPRLRRHLVGPLGCIASIQHARSPDTRGFFLSLSLKHLVKSSRPINNSSSANAKWR